MSIPGSASPLFFTAAADAAAAGPIKSVRFNRSDSAYLSRTPSSTGNRRTFTFSAWLKRSESTSGDQYFFGAYASKFETFRFQPGTDKLQLLLDGANTANLVTDAKFVDFSAWFHVVLAVDTTQATSTDRVKIYVNGAQITSFSTETYPTQNYDSDYNNSGASQQIGATLASGFYHGYMADLYLIDGQQLDPTSFGAFDDNGVWQAAAYSGTFGTNGFHLFDFANESGIGDDASGNDNDFTANNLSAEASFYATAGTHAGKDGISFNGTNAEITLSSDADVNPGSGVFTLECYAYALSGGSAEFGIYDGSPGGAGSFVLRRVGAGTLMVERSDQAFDITGAAFSEDTWHHVAVTRDSSNNVRLFVDGTQSGSTSTNNTQNYQGTFRLGRTNNAFTNGYISNLRLIKGTCLYTSNFTAPTGNLTNVTNTKLLMAQSTTSPTAATVKPSGVTISGSGDGSVIDVLFDVPTNGSTDDDTGAGGEVSGNYCTLNPLAKTTGRDPTLTNGNLDFGADTNSNFTNSVGTIAVSSGKWYVEYTIGTNVGSSNGLGFINSESLASAGGSYGIGQASDGWLRTTSVVYNNSSSVVSSLTSISSGDVVMLALDIDNGKAWWGLNGTFENSGDPGAGSNAMVTFTPGGKSFVVGISAYHSSVVASGVINFGARSFDYTAPSGFSPLCSTLLPTPTIANGRDHFDVKLYTGNGGSSTITVNGYNFAPNLVWLKGRSDPDKHGLYDTVRGATKLLIPSSAAGESTQNGVTAFNSDGFDIGNYAETNGSNRTYVAWAWNIPGSASSNTDGTITSSVVKNADAGISHVTWTGTGSAGTIGHGLNSKPDLIIAKVYGDSSYSDNWPVYSSVFDGTHYAYLNDTRKFTDFTGFWNDGTATSTVFPVGSYNSDDTKSLFALCFTSVAGFSKIGSYEGNGSTTAGVFVNTNFRPAWILVKRADNTSTYGSWAIYDSTRSTFNTTGTSSYNFPLWANRDAQEGKRGDGSSAASGSENIINFFSNGFMALGSGAELNVANETYVYMAFASNSFSANGGLAF
jgi:hypothetical protein